MDQQLSVRQLAAPSRAGSFPAFDWLRFVLASVVALDHSGLHFGLAGLAVQVFFALSGWLIGGILLKTSAGELPGFFYRRGTRIWIPYFLAAGLLYAFALARDGLTPGFFHYLFHDVTLTHNWFIDMAREREAMPLEGTGGHFWTISVEEQFYLGAPLLMMTVAWGKKLPAWIGVLALAALLSWWNFQYLSITFGVVCAIIHRDYGDWHTRRWVRLVLAVVAVATVSVIVGGGYLTGVVYNALAPFFAISVVLLSAVEGRRNEAALFLGGLSYPLYLNHWIGVFAGHFAAKHVLAMPFAAMILMAYLVNVGVAAAAYLMIDRNIQLYRGRFYTKGRGKAFMGTAYTLCLTGLTFGLLGFI